MYKKTKMRQTKEQNRVENMKKGTRLKHKEKTKNKEK